MELSSTIRTLALIYKPESDEAAQEELFRGKLLGLFLSRQLEILGMSHESFAAVLDIDLNFAKSLLGGTVPVSVIGNELLSDIARATGFTSTILKILLHREPDLAKFSKANNYIEESPCSISQDFLPVGETLVTKKS